MTASHREILGGLLVAFVLVPAAHAQAGGGEGSGGPPMVAPDLPGTLTKFPDLDAWSRIAPNGRITVFTGKAELGTGIKTANAPLAADKLDVAFDRIDLINADIGLIPNEGVQLYRKAVRDTPRRRCGRTISIILDLHHLS